VIPAMVNAWGIMMLIYALVTFINAAVKAHDERQAGR
jgi:hypothetical protein